VAGLLLALPPLCVQAQWLPALEASLLYDDNLSRAQLASDVVRDFAAIGRGALSRSFASGDRADFSVSLDARLARYLRFEHASSLSLGIAGGYTRKLGLGLTAPRLLADAWVAHEESPARVRDARRFGVSLTLSKRFDERVHASVGAGYERRKQIHDLPVLPGVSGEPFSLQGRSLFARGDFAAGGRATIFAGASLRRGDVEASTRRHPQIFGASSAIAADPAIGPDYVAYRLSGASTRALSAGLSWELDRRSSAEVSFSFERTRAGAGLHYDVRMLALSYVHRP
jgi:hypothetical protein